MKRFLYAGVFALGLAFAAQSASAVIVRVNIFNFDFSTNGVGQPIVDPVINVGDTIEWFWVEGFHDTTSVDGQLESWASPTTAQAGFTFQHTFTNVGVYDYYCSIHGSAMPGMPPMGMAGTVTVVPEPNALPVLAALLPLGAAIKRRFKIQR